MSSACLACHQELGQQPVLSGKDFLHGVPGVFDIYQCRACGSGTTLPLAEEKDLAAFYPSSYLPYKPPGGLLGKVMAVVQRARMRNQPLRSAVARTPGHALDVGCGRGDLGAELVRQGWRVAGVEPDPQAAAVARSRGLEVYEGVLAGAKVAAPPAGFDVIVFQHCLEHVLDPVADLERARNLLAADGLLVITLPHWNNWQRRVFGRTWFPLELPRHRTHFTREGLRRCLEEAGFSRIDLHTTSSFICLCWTLQYKFAGRLLSESGSHLLVGYALSALLWPLAFIADRIAGDGDFLHARAQK